MSPATRTAKMSESTMAEDAGETNGAITTSASQVTLPASNRLAAALADMVGETADELVGSYVAPTSESATTAPDDTARHEAVSGSGNALEFEDVPSQHESANGESGLEEVEGYTPEPRAAVDERSLPDAFMADASLDDKEFLPLLGKLAPVLISTVLPIVKKRVLTRGNLRRVGSVISAARGIAGSLLSESAEETDEAIEAELEAAAEQMEVIIGTDDRTRIRNTTAIPWRRICQLTIRAKNGAQYVGTGFLIGKRTVITAGHCVYIHSAGGWPAYIDVAPGRNGGARPFGTVRAIQYRSVTGWVNSKSRDHDYGAIILPANTPLVVQSLGGFGFGYWPDSQLHQRMVNLSGYPGDGGKLGPDREAASQWWMARQIKAVGSRSFSYDIDTVGGQSGSPVWTLHNGQRIAVGIHTNGFIGGNSATRITQPVFNNLRTWRQQGS
jgi:V8-like Glu-specific endopeptidase